MRCHALLLSAAFTLTLAAGVDAGEPNIDTSHLRPLNETGVALLADAQQKSPTVRQLIDKLEASNLVAYLNVVPLAEDSPESGLRFVGSSNVQRYVVIVVSDDGAIDRRTELLGHELQHAVELASRPRVTEDTDFQNLVRRLTWYDSAWGHGWDTAAVRTESEVAREVRAARRAR